MDSRKAANSGHHRRKSASPSAAGGGVSGVTPVKSPPALAIKRSDTAPVILQGWLYKQGSEGLQLWKKRWFVLSEYCLFYYKGPDEDKQLGSILLPSYTISPLSKDDGVLRKFAFKAEHANMRTYYFAAETKDSMIQWMNSLSLASILQNENNLKPEMLARQLARQGGSGGAHQLPPHLRQFAPHQHRSGPPQHQQQQHQQQLRNSHHNHHQQQQQHYLQQQQQRQSYTHLVQSGPSTPMDGGDGSMLEGGRQPLYANAPPKPRRLTTTSRDYSPSSDTSPERQPPNIPPHHPHGVSGEDPGSLANNSNIMPRHRLPQERRTPEAYGRSNPRFPKEYEEVYGNNNTPAGSGDSVPQQPPFDAQSNNRRLSDGSYGNSPRSTLPLPPPQAYLGGNAHLHPPKQPAVTAADDFLSQYLAATMTKISPPKASSTQLHQRPHSEYYPPAAPYRPGLPLPAHEENHNNNAVGRHQPHRHHQQVPPPASRVPRPHSADFLEYERSHPLTEELQHLNSTADRGGQKAGQQIAHRRGGHTQPPRPKSSIGELRHADQPSDDFWSEEVYAQKMRESSYAYDPVASRSQSRGPVGGGSGGLWQNAPLRGQSSDQDEAGNRFSAASFGAQHQQLPPPPAFYQDRWEEKENSQQLLNQSTSPRGQQQQQHLNASVSSATSISHQQEGRRQQSIPQNASFAEDNPGQQQQRVSIPQFSPNPNLNHYHHHNTSGNQHQLDMVRASPFPQQQQHQAMLLRQSQMSPNGDMTMTLSREQGNAHHQPVKVTNRMMMQQAAADTPVVPSPSFPQPTPRKINNNSGHHTPTMYQNLPTNSKAYSDPRPGRLETATPNRFSERFDSDRSADSQLSDPSLFRRSASARLPKQKQQQQRMDYNMLHEESDASKSNSEQREESMKRLLEWKQRMLQSPLTRKSSRNASRTQTPTNSDSPVPSLNNDDIRKRVIEELAAQGGGGQDLPGGLLAPAGRERRVSRKGSTGSRSSRSRSSPRIAPSKNNMYSSDDDDAAPVEPRQSRKRMKSQQSRSRNSSRESRRGGGSSSGGGGSNRSAPETAYNTKSPSSRNPLSQAADYENNDSHDESQPQYINIDSLKSGGSRQAGHQHEVATAADAWMTATAAKLSSTAIGPDDWYRDDFNFDKGHPFMEDPLLLQQYAQVLDLRFREAASAAGGHHEGGQSLENLHHQQLQLKKPQTQQQAGALGMRLGRYPDSGYDTLHFNPDEQQVCVDVDHGVDRRQLTSSSVPGVKLRSREMGTSMKASRRAQTWHSSADSEFASFQLLEKQNATVLLSIHGQEEDLPHSYQRNASSGNVSSENNKIDWSPTKSTAAGVSSYQEIRRIKEAPPKNVVRERLKSFERPQEGEEGPKSKPEVKQDEEGRRSARPAKQQRQEKATTRYRSKSVNYSSDEETNVDCGTRTLEKKRSVKDLLQDFEQKSKETEKVGEKEEALRDRSAAGIGSYLLQDSPVRDSGSAAGNRRRVFSDTETLMYETSSDEANSSDFGNQIKSNNVEFSDRNGTGGNIVEGDCKQAKSEVQNTSVSPGHVLRDPPPLPPKNQVTLLEESKPHDESGQYNSKSLGRESMNTKYQDACNARPAPISLNLESKQSVQQVDPQLKSVPAEETYLAMTPSKSLSSLHHHHQTPLTGSAGSRKHSSGALVTSQASLTSSHSSLQSLNRFGSDKNILGSMTPTEALIATATSSSSVGAQHSRTPSQSLVMEHLQLQEEARRLEEETYVDMNDDGSVANSVLHHQQHKKMRSEPILSRQRWREQDESHLDTTLTGGGDVTESPRYCEIEDPNAQTEAAHYEYLYRATSVITQQQHQHYEVVYQEIPENANQIETGVMGDGIGKTHRQDGRSRRAPEPLRPIEGLPDILGNAPTNKGNSSSDADDESSKDFDIDVKQLQQEQLSQAKFTASPNISNKITLDDSFRPASFYLSHSKSISNSGLIDEADDTDDSDLVSPPPVPSSPPPMDVVLGHKSQSTLDAPCPPANLNNILTAAKSAAHAQALREHSRHNSVDDDQNRRPSVGSRTSYGSHNSLLSQHGSQQSLHSGSVSYNNPELGLPHLSNQHYHQQQRFLHGSHQSLGSRELPPLPTGATSQLGSQQSLASKEVQLIGSAHHGGQNSAGLLTAGEGIRHSPYHSREGSLDNEMFLYHRFTQGSSIGDPYKKQQSSDELSSSDTATTNYEQEYRKYHLENIQEVSNTLERTDSHNTSVISQDLNISYNSVYDSRLQQSKVYRIEDHPALKKRKSLDERGVMYTSSSAQQASSGDEQLGANVLSSPRSKVPYYVSDIMDPANSAQFGSLHFSQPYLQMADRTLTCKPAAGTMVDVITKSMNALDIESSSYFESRNELENERIRKLRRSYTPDPYNGVKARGSTPAVVASSRPLSPETQPLPYPEGANAVSRSKSLEGLLGDSQGTPKDNLGYSQQASRMYSPHNFNDIPGQPRPARGHQPPPPPDDVPPLNIQPHKSSPIAQQGEFKDSSSGAGGHRGRENNQSAEDEMWADTLRKTSLRHQAVRSPEHNNIKHGRNSLADDDIGQISWKEDSRAGWQSVPVGSKDPESDRQRRESRGRAAVPPPTAPKPKTPVPFVSSDGITSSRSAGTTVPVKRNTSAADLLEQQQQQWQQQQQLQKGQQQQQQQWQQQKQQQQGQQQQQQQQQQQGQQQLQQQYQHWQSQQQFYPHQQPATDHSTLSYRYGRQQQESTGQNTTTKGQENFLEVSLPAPISREGGRLTATLPARTRSSASQQLPSNSANNPSADPGPPPPQRNVCVAVPHGGQLPVRQESTDGPILSAARHRRRSLSSGRQQPSDLEMLKKRFGGNLYNITAGDLLGKTQEELVLLLIQLRRQSSSLMETIDTCKAELDNYRNTREQGGEELRQHTWSLEEQVARLQPIINLVDNMVKLGTLYRGLNNTGRPSAYRHKAEERLEGGAENFGRQTGGGGGGEDDIRYQRNLQLELEHVQSQLKMSQKKLDASSSELEQFERDIFSLRQELSSTSGAPGGRNRQLAASLEAELRHVQDRAGQLQRSRGELVRNIHYLRGKENLLTSEIRPSPTGVAGAEKIPPRHRMPADHTWLETDIDANTTRDRAPETEQQRKKENKVNQHRHDDGQVYVNTFEDDPEHNYENYAAQAARNPYEDDVQTVHSEGVRSEYEAPPIPERPKGRSGAAAALKEEQSMEDEDEEEEEVGREVVGGLGELGEADERVQRYYGIIPKEKPIEIKTVRMVKRDHKERISKGRRNDDDSETVDLSMEDDEEQEEDDPPPPPLPRGNYQPLHNFLSQQPYHHANSNTSNSYDNEDEMLNNNITNSNNHSNNTQQRSSSRPNFKLGEYYSNSRPASALSAHERLFGTSREDIRCREDSLSPDMSPAKSVNSINSSDSSSQSALLSPVFRSAAARAIIEEERKAPMIIPKARKKSGSGRKQRNMTITSSHPAVLEAINRHQQQQENRSRDDLDIERMLKPRDAPDVVRSTYADPDASGTGEPRGRDYSIDNLFGVPDKINIPERYVPEQDVEEEQTPEERRTRLKKADSIRRMLADTATGSAGPLPKKNSGGGASGGLSDDKKAREQLLALNQVLARQVMEKSRMVAGQVKES